jgi:uncharacterized repeat protein (TIGR02543 family)
MDISKRVQASLIAFIFFVASGLFIMADSPNSFATTPALTMGSSSTFGVLASAAVTSANASDISGTAGRDVGVGGATLPTGTITRSGSQILGGASLTALSDANSAFSDLRTSTALPVELGGTTLTDGAYSGGTFGLNGTLTLDGLNNPASVFIFNTTTTLITAASSQVVLINGAQAYNVFWQIGSSATLGASSTTVGHLIASASISTGATTTVDGQLIALTGAVTLGGTSIVNDICAPPINTVTFDGNTSDGGATAPQSTSVTTALTTNGFTKTGYTFAGWNTLANGSGTAYANNSTYSFTADLILFAQWTIIPPLPHTVTFLGNTSDGGSTASETATITTPLTANGFTRTGYTYADWNTFANGTGTGYANTTNYSFAADLTLYAQWTAIPPLIVPTPPAVLPTPPAVLPTPPAVLPTPPTPVPAVTSPRVIVPLLPPVTGTLHIIKLVENRFGGTSVPSDFAMIIRKTGSSIHFDPVQGTSGLGALLYLEPGTYDLSEAPTPGYRGLWSGAISAGGRVLIIENQDTSVTRTNFDMMNNSAVLVPTPSATSTPTPTYSPPAAPTKTATGGILPTTATPWGNMLIIGCCLILLGTLLCASFRWQFKSKSIRQIKNS